MWYLVVPPIVVVLSLFFLLWYLSRKGDDPIVAQKILENGETHSVVLLQVKEFFLRRVEKLAQRFKVNLLRAHNALNEFTQSIKKTRTKMRRVDTEEVRSSQEEIRQEVVPEQKSASKSGFWSSRRQVPENITTAPVKSTHSDDLLNTVIVRKEKESEKYIAPEEKKILPPRPMVSEVVARPEIRKGRVSDGGVREESLIARIARDPKDFTAYEELGDHYLETGNIKDAKECYRQVLKLSPVHRMVKIKIRRLEKLLTRGGE